jgi:hypothetical protein
MSKFVAVLAGVVSLFIVLPAFGEIYRCIDEQGKQVISDTPCPSRSKDVRHKAPEQPQTHAPVPAPITKQEVTPKDLRKASIIPPDLRPPASASQVQSTPLPKSIEPSASQGYQSLECQLASINIGRVVTESHRQVSQFRTLLNSIESKVRNTRQEIADITVKSQQLLRNQGKRMELLGLMLALDISIPDSATVLRLNFAEVAALFVTLTASK